MKKIFFSQYVTIDPAFSNNRLIDSGSEDEQENS